MRFDAGVLELDIKLTLTILPGVIEEIKRPLLAGIRLFVVEDA
jgi:hypothetical protein